MTNTQPELWKQKIPKIYTDQILLFTGFGQKGKAELGARGMAQSSECNVLAENLTIFPVAP